MSEVLRSSPWKYLACALALAGGIFIGLIIPASPGNATAIPKQCAANQSVFRVYYSDSTLQHAVCQDVYEPLACKTHFCDVSPWYKDSCGSTCIIN
jgi:hypothetical protein